MGAVEKKTSSTQGRKSVAHFDILMRTREREHVMAPPTLTQVEARNDQAVAVEYNPERVASIIDEWSAELEWLADH